MEPICEQFPAWQSEIEHLYQENADFREMCEDYEQVRCLLSTWTVPTEVNPATIDEYRTLLKELEAEITEALQARFQSVELPEQDSATQPTSFIEQGGDGEDQPATHI
jgi:uncharacterized protein YdcH (DUF465 family)